MEIKIASIKDLYDILRSIPRDLSKIRYFISTISVATMSPLTRRLDVSFGADPLKTSGPFEASGYYRFARVGITHPTPMGITHLVNRQGRHVLSRHYARRTSEIYQWCLLVL